MGRPRASGAAPLPSREGGGVPIFCQSAISLDLGRRGGDGPGPGSRGPFPPAPSARHAVRGTPSPMIAQITLSRLRATAFSASPWHMPRPRRARQYSPSLFSLRHGEPHEKTGGFPSPSSPRLDARADEADVPERRFLGAIPQCDARWSRSGTGRRRRRRPAPRPSSARPPGPSAGTRRTRPRKQGGDLRVEPRRLPDGLPHPPGRHPHLPALRGDGALGRSGRGRRRAGRCVRISRNSDCNGLLVDDSWFRVSHRRKTDYSYLDAGIISTC